MEELESWTVGGDIYNRANLLPLQPRPAANTGPQLFIFHDMYGGYIPDGDLYPQGTPNPNYYAFNFWQYVDIFSYFTHHWVAVPPPSWINAGHRNGVPILGNLTPPYGDNGSFVQPMLDATDLYVEQLVAIAQYYGFDGWAFNFETNLLHGNKSARQLVTFLSRLTSRLHSALAGSKVVWYDSVDMQGIISYQNELNANNGPYFEACDGIFLNYNWSTAGLNSSATYAGDRARDVFAGIQPFIKQFDTYQSLQQADQAGVSGGLFAQSWTYQKQTDSDPFEKREQRFWIGHPPQYPKPQNCVASVISERPLPATYPLVTNFNVGRGRMFFVDGSQVSAVGTEPAEVHWGNLSAQDILPTYRYWTSAGSPRLFEPRICHDAAFDGGGSLLIAAARSRKGDSIKLTLFNVALTIPADCTFSLTFMPFNEASLPELAVILACVSGDIALPQSATGGAGWQTVTTDLSSHAGAQIPSVQLKITAASDTLTEVAVLIGELKLMDIAAPQYPAAVMGLSAVDSVFTQSAMGSMISSLDLIWDAPIDDACAWNVYQVLDSSTNVTYIFLGRAFTTAWHLENFVFGTVQEVTFCVQPRNRYGYNQPLGSATAIVSVTWANQDSTNIGAADV